jgi:putative ABC transport system permease protein
MHQKDIMKLSTRMFKTNPSRTWLTILGMGVGTGAVVMLVGLGFGLQGILLEQIVLGDTLLSLTISNPSSRAITINPKSVEDIGKIENVKDVAPLAGYSASLSLGGLNGNVSLQAIDPPYFKYAGISATVGSIFVAGQEGVDANSVILSTGVLTLFGMENPEEALGKPVRLKVFVTEPGVSDVREVSLDKEYTVKGIIDNSASITLYIPLSELSTHFQIQEYERAQVRVTDTGFLNAVQDKLIEKGFNVTALSKTVDQANKIFQGVQAVLALFGGIALIVSAIGMFNTMTVTLLERTSEIGIMRTIGASPSDIKILFLMEAIIVGFLGGVVGILIGIVIGGGINLLMNSVAVRFGGAAMSLFRFPWGFLGFIMGFSCIVGFITGIFPARRAASLNPLDAIRYK